MVLSWPDERVSLPLDSFLLMLLAGLGWALYSLEGRKVKDPLLTTTWNFIYVLPITLLALIMADDPVLVTSKGILLALVSGALMSGLGYAL